MQQDPRIQQRAATTILSKRTQVRLESIGAAMGGAFGEVYGHLAARRVAAAGPPFVIYPEMPTVDRPFEIEICAPIRGPVDAPPGWQVRELPAATVATLLHVGPYNTVGASYEALSSWVAARGLLPAGSPREVYLSPSETPPDQTETLIELPVAETTGANDPSQEIATGARARQ